MIDSLYHGPGRVRCDDGKIIVAQAFIFIMDISTGIGLQRSNVWKSSVTMTKGMTLAKQSFPGENEVRCLLILMGPFKQARFVLLIGSRLDNMIGTIA